MPEEQRTPRGRTQRVPIVRERAQVTRRARATAVVRVRKQVERRTEIIDEPLTRDEVVIERVPIDRFVDAPIPDRYEGDTLVVSVLEEVVVVQKRLKLKEELRISRRRTTTREPQVIDLAEESVVVERRGVDGRSIPDTASRSAAPRREAKEQA